MNDAPILLRIIHSRKLLNILLMNFIIFAFVCYQDTAPMCGYSDVNIMLLLTNILTR